MRNTNQWKRFAWTAALAGALVLPAYPQEADNTKANKGEQTTADKAKNNASDLDTMKKIRQALMDDRSLSTYAHNVKVIAQDGKVTLKGPVRSDAEKATVEATAAKIAGAGNVDSQLTVKPDTKNPKTPQR